MTPLKAIRAFCHICNGESEGGKRYDCMDHNCPLYLFKDGRGNYENPNQPVSAEHLEWLRTNGKEVKKRRTVTPEQRQAARERRMAFLASKNIPQKKLQS